MYLYVHICRDRCRAVSVEASMGSLDSKNCRAPGNHLKTTGLEESIHAFLSTIDALALQKDPGYFPDVFEMFPPSSTFFFHTHVLTFKS